MIVLHVHVHVHVQVPMELRVFVSTCISQEIRPYETKPIARANFFGRTAINHTSFIRVKTNLDESPSIILPVEVEVSESHGLYLSRELLDFGILKSGGERGRERTSVCMCPTFVTGTVAIFGG